MAQTDTHSDTGLKYFLTIPHVFLYFQRLVGIDKYYRNLMKDYIPSVKNIKVLDIGCGCAYILDYLPETTFYTGVDMNPAYIRYAQKRYGKKGVFSDSRVNDFTSDTAEKFDVVLALNVVHHLNDGEAKTLYKMGFESLKKGGVMIVSDPSYDARQSAFSRLLCKMDRGKNIRYREGYEQLAKIFFREVHSDVRPDMLYLPQYTTVVVSTKTHS